MSQHGVSVIIPSFNQGRFLGSALQSVKDQEHPLLEVIICDACSSDETENVVRLFPSLDITFVSEKDRGQGDAVNKGVSLAKYKIIAWLNSDDEYVSGTLRFVSDYFSNESKSTPAIYGRTLKVDENGSVIGQMPVRQWCYDELLNHTYICQPSVFFLRDFFYQVGGINSRLHLSLDYDLWLRMGRYQDFVFIDKVFSKNRDYVQTKTNSFKLESRIEFLCCSYVYGGGVWSKAWLWRLAHFQAMSFVGRDSPIQLEVIKRYMFAVYLIKINFKILPTMSKKLNSTLKQIRLGGDLSLHDTE